MHSSVTATAKTGACLFSGPLKGEEEGEGEAQDESHMVRAGHT